MFFKKVKTQTNSQQYKTQNIIKKGQTVLDCMPFCTKHLYKPYYITSGNSNMRLFTVLYMLIYNSYIYTFISSICTRL